MKGKIFLFVVPLAFFILASSASGAVGPVASLNERVKAHYNADGAPDAGTNWSQCEPASNPCKYGYLEVGAPNTEDVLQHIRVNISSVTDTSLNSPQAYKGVLSSLGGPWEMNQLYFNSSADGNGDNDLYYEIVNPPKAPSLALTLSVGNAAGGSDVYDEDNIRQHASGYTSTNSLSINLTVENPSMSRSFDGVEVTFQFNNDTGNSTEDIINVTGVSSSTTGTVTTASGPSSSNFDGNDNYSERVTWEGDFGIDSSLTLNIQAETQSNINWDDANVADLDGDDEGTTADWGDTDNTSVYFTQKSMDYKFSRGPIRQGTDLINSTLGWMVRGFIRNMGTSSGINSTLTYNVTQWSVWNVSDDGTLGTQVKAGTYDPSLLTPADGRIYTTDLSRSNDTNWYETGGVIKPYFASEFTWEVVWNDTNAEEYVAMINTSLNMPLLHKLDLSNSQVVSGVLSPETQGEVLKLNYTSQYVGSPESPSQTVTIYSVVPGTNNNGDTPGTGTYFEIINTTEGVTVYFDNTTQGGSTYTLDPANYNADVVQPNSAGDDGYVNVTIPDTSNTLIGAYLNNSESIITGYEVISNTTMNSGNSFNFTGNATDISDTGTPLTEPMPGTTISVAGKRLIGYKDLIAYDPAHPTLVNTSMVMTVADAAGGGIDDIMFTDYVPLGTDFSTSEVTVKFYDDSLGTWRTPSYQIKDQGNITLPDGTKVHAYEYVNSTSPDTGWHLDDGDSINVSYQVNITESGLYEMPATLVGVDPATGETLRSKPVGVVQISVPRSRQPLDVSEGDLQQAQRPTVGDKVEWVKNFEVFNPNGRPTEGKFKTKVFKDTQEAFISYTGDSGERRKVRGQLEEIEGEMYLTWQDRLQAMEDRRYEIRLMTPMVIETSRDVRVLEELEDKRVKLQLDISLRNFAQEDYENLRLNLPIPYGHVHEVRDGYGNQLQATGGKSSTSIALDSIEAEELRTLSVIYEQPYPTIVVTPERDSYSAGSNVTLSVLVINGGKEIEYPSLETEIYAPGMQVIKSELQQLESMEPLEKTELTEKYKLQTKLPRGEYIANARFREDFSTLASSTGKFYVKSGVEPGTKTIPTLIILGALLMAAYVAYGKIKQARGDRQ